jgi:hypothetical protein
VFFFKVFSSFHFLATRVAGAFIGLQANSLFNSVFWSLVFGDKQQSRVMKFLHQLLTQIKSAVHMQTKYSVQLILHYSGRSNGCEAEVRS